MKAKLAILRHGQTEYNLQNLMTGQRDVPLTALGEDQAREAGKLLDQVVFDKAYSSPLSRAFNTAALALGNSPHNAGLKDQVIVDKALLETNHGDFTGRNKHEDPEIKAWGRSFDIPAPNGESVAQVVARVRAFYEEEIMPRIERGENIVIFAHAGIVRAFDYILDVKNTLGHHANVQGKRIPNATPTVFEYDDGKLVDCYLLINDKEQDAKPRNKGPKLGP